MLEQRKKLKINNFLRRLKKLSLFSDETYKQLFVTGSGPGILYGLPKLHKCDFAQSFRFRPIFAAYNTASYKISKFLVPILAPLTTNNYTVANSYSFVKKLHSINNADDLHMASFDITNLYTNIPLKETIAICLNKLFTTAATTVIGLNRNLFKTLLEHSVLNSFFMFNSELYKQVEGVGMGLPLGPTFANIFLCHHEINWLNDCPETFKPVFYQRYIDDTFLLFNDKNHVQQFLDYVNVKHPNINFTVENEKQGTLSFLDINISRSNNKFVTSVFRKDTFTGLGLSYFSFCCNRFKINAIKTLIHRAYNISSNYLLLHQEFEFLKSYFINNGYPLFLILSVIRKFLYNNFTVHDTGNNSTTHNPVKYISLPFFGPQSEKMRSDLLKLLTKYCPTVNYKIVLSSSFKLGNFF